MYLLHIGNFHQFANMGHEMVGDFKLLPALTGEIQDKLMRAVTGKFYKEHQPPTLQ